MASKLYETGKFTSKPLNQMANAHAWDLVNQFISKSAIQYNTCQIFQDSGDINK